MKNLMDFCIGTPCFWLVGFGIMFGSGTALFGTIDPLIMGDYSSILPAGVPLWAYAIFQTVFCATAATIVSGAMAERTKFSAYCIYSAAISLVIYPVSGRWIWGGGWLAQLGFHDFAGSTAVHMAVSYTHLDVYKRQDLLGLQLPQPLPGGAQHPQALGDHLQAGGLLQGDHPVGDHLGVDIVKNLAFHQQQHPGTCLLYTSGGE